MSIKVRIWSDGYYPCGYQLQPVSDKWTERYLAVLRETYREDPEPMAVVDSLEGLDLSSRQRSRLEASWEVVVLMDPWVLGHYYGWDAHTAFEGGAA